MILAKVRRLGCVTLLGVGTLMGFGCTAVVTGSPVSGRPFAKGQREVFISTGAAPRPYQTLGFIHITGWGNQVAGVMDIGDANFDATVHNALVNEVVRMQGDGVINLEFEDQNPQTPADRAGDLADTFKTNARGQHEVKTRWRAVVAVGEVIKFVD